MKRNPLDEALDASPMLVALADAGRFLRAARELARDEADEAFWAEGEQISEVDVDEPLRLAAQDAATFESGDWRVELHARDVGIEATLVAGREGASLRVGAGLVPLRMGLAVPVVLDIQVDAVYLLDARGREIELRRRD